MLGVHLSFRYGDLGPLCEDLVTSHKAFDNVHYNGYSVVLAYVTNTLMPRWVKSLSPQRMLHH